MNEASPAGCALVLALVIAGAVWMITLITSLLFRPEEDEPMRTRERVLVVVSIVMILLLGATRTLLFR